MSLLAKYLPFFFASSQSTRTPINPEGSPSLEYDEIASIAREDSTSSMPASSMPATLTPTTPPTQPRSTPATTVGLQLSSSALPLWMQRVYGGLRSSFLVLPLWVQRVYGALENRLRERVRGLHETGRNITRFILGAVIDPVAPDVESGIAHTHHGTRHSWVYPTVVFLVGLGVMALIVMALGGMITLPQIRGMFERVRQVVLTEFDHLPFH